MTRKARLNGPFWLAEIEFSPNAALYSRLQKMTAVQGIQTAHNCVFLLDGRQPDCAVILVLHHLQPLPLLPLFLKPAIINAVEKEFRFNRWADGPPARKARVRFL